MRTRLGPIVALLLAGAGCTDAADAPVPAPTPRAAPAEAAPAVADPGAEVEVAATPSASALGPALPEAGSESGDEPALEAEAEQPGQGEVEPGDSLSRILHRAGLDAQAVHELTLALDGTMDPTLIRAGQRYRVELDDEGQLRSFELELDKTTRARAERDGKGELAARLVEAETRTVEVEVGGTIQSSLWAAITGANQHPSLVSFLVDVFAYDLDFFTDTHPGDTFRVVVERIELPADTGEPGASEPADAEFVGYGRILAAEYAGRAGTFRVFWFDPSKGEPRYVDDEGKGVARTLLKTPLKFSRVSSEFDPKRMHPILHREKGHNGIDYAAPEGTPVWAAADGRITVRELRKGAGNMVILAHANGMTTLYMHLSRFADGQKRGMNVKAKTVIGYVGMTGLATGPHLHFGVKVNGRYVDPKTMKQHRGAGVPTSDAARWKRERARLVERLEAIELGGATPATPG